MKLWVTLLLLLLIACVAAFGWQILAVDPGYVLVKFGNTSIETSLVFALLMLVVGWGVLSFAWWLLSWPRAAWSRRTRRRGRVRIASGLVALTEGRYAQALRDLERAAHQSGLHAPALLAAARAAHARGDNERAQALLGKVAHAAAPAALALRARFLLEQGKADAALALLKPQAKAATLAPAGWRMLAESALLCGDHAVALDALAPLARSQTLKPLAFSALESRVLAGALTGAAESESLNALWSGLSRTQRRIPEAVIAYTRRAAALGQMLPAMSEIEALLRKEWSEQAIRAYGELGPADSETRLRHAEAWLPEQLESSGLLLTLGRLCVQGKLWGKAREYLERGLAIDNAPAMWECLGDCAAGQGNRDEAASCYRNALRVARGETVEALPGMRAVLSTRASVIEERSEHGVPRLPVRSGAN